MSFREDTVGVEGRSIDKLNSEELVSEDATWNFDTEEFSKYFYSKFNDDFSSQMCTVYRLLGDHGQIDMKEGDIFENIATGYKIYKNKSDTEPVHAQDGNTFKMVIGDRASFLQGFLATLSATILLVLS